MCMLILPKEQENGKKHTFKCTLGILNVHVIIVKSVKNKIKIIVNKTKIIK